MTIEDFQQTKIDRDRPTLDEVISSFGCNNCDQNRPFLEQQPKRSQMNINSLTRRDIQDCMVLGILSCKGSDKYEELPKIYLSEKGNKFTTFDDLEASKEGYGDSYIDPERVTWNDLYGWNLDDIDPIAAVQNMACHLERRLGIFPAMLDF